MLTILTSYGIENIEVSTIVNKIFQSGGLGKIMVGMKALGTLALLFYFVPKLERFFLGKNRLHQIF